MPPQPASTEPADLQQIPLEELERMIMDRAGALEQVMAQSARGDVMPAEPEMEMAGSEMAPEGAMPDGGEINPGAVKAASAMLVEAGLLEEITDTLTPEVLNVLTMLAEQEAPGLYDIQNVAHLMELINGIRTGLIPLSIEPRQQAAPELGPVPIPGGGGLPGSAGLPGGGLQPLPGEYPSGLPRGGAY
tara:strand:+ start:1677 stop:2243 length:567 start_codon:yes stop_codon:yes gene_type:complete